MCVIACIETILFNAYPDLWSDTIYGNRGRWHEQPDTKSQQFIEDCSDFCSTISGGVKRKTVREIDCFGKLGSKKRMFRVLRVLQDEVKVALAKVLNPLNLHLKIAVTLEL